MTATNSEVIRSIQSMDRRSRGDGLNALPEDLWLRILQTGVGSGQLKYRDLCSLAIVSTGLKRSCESDILWKELVAQEFPESVNAKEPPKAEINADAEANWKGFYKVRFKKVRAKKIAAQRRQVLKVISSLNALRKEVRSITKRLAQEKETLLASQRELRRLDRSRRSSVALQIWQPQAVSTRHQQVVEQAPVDLEARVNALINDVRECKLRIQCFETAVKTKTLTIDLRLADLDSLLYTPMGREGLGAFNDRTAESWKRDASAIHESTSEFLRSNGIYLEEYQDRVPTSRGKEMLVPSMNLLPTGYCAEESKYGGSK